MAKKNKKKDPQDIALEAMKMDLDFRNRELAAKQAEAAAQQAFARQHMLLIEQGAQAAQAEQFAKQYALQIGQLEYEKTLGAAQLGLSAESQRHSQRMDLMRQQFDESFNQAAQMGFRDGVPTLDRYKHDSTLAEQQRQFDVDSSGYNNGRATLDRETMERSLGENQRQFNVGQSGYMNGAATFEREQALEGQRQFDVNTIMNAPRGAADYVSYIKKLRGLEGQGLAPGLLAQLAGGEAVRTAGVSNAGQWDGPVASNLDLAQAATSTSRQTPTISRNMDPRLAGLIGSGAQQNINVSSDPSQGQAQGGQFWPGGQQQGAPNMQNDLYRGPNPQAPGGIPQGAQPQMYAGGSQGFNEAGDMQTMGPESLKGGSAPSGGYMGANFSHDGGPQMMGPESLMAQANQGGNGSYSVNHPGVQQYLRENPSDTAQQAISWLQNAATPEQKAGMVQRGAVHAGAAGPSTPDYWTQPPEYNMVGGGGSVPYTGQESWGQAQAQANQIDWRNATNFEANRAMTQANGERSSILGALWSDAPPDPSQYQSRQYQPTGQETRPTVDGTTQRPGNPNAPSNGSFPQYASQPTFRPQGGYMKGPYSGGDVRSFQHDPAPQMGIGSMQPWNGSQPPQRGSFGPSNDTGMEAMGSLDDGQSQGGYMKGPYSGGEVSPLQRDPMPQMGIGSMRPSSQGGSGASGGYMGGQSIKGGAAPQMGIGSMRNFSHDGGPQTMGPESLGMYQKGTSGQVSPMSPDSGPQMGIGSMRPSSQQYSSQGGADPWSTARSSSPSSSDPGVNQMMSQVYSSQKTPTVKTGDQWSEQAYRKLSPIERQFAGGLVESETGQGQEDFDWSRQNAAPGFERSRKATWSGM